MQRRRRTAAVIVALMLPAMAGLNVVPAAGADTTTVLDGDDSPGRLDLSAARHGHHTTDSGRRLLKHRVVTYERWRARLLSSDNTYVLLSLDPFGGNAWRFVKVTANDEGQLRAVMVKGREPNQHVVGEVRVWRQDRHNLTVAFPRRHLGNNVGGYRWDVLTSYQKSGDEQCGEPAQVVAPPEATCPDDLGEDIVHDLR